MEDDAGTFIWGALLFIGQIVVLTGLAYLLLKGMVKGRDWAEGRRKVLPFKKRRKGGKGVSSMFD